MGKKHKNRGYKQVLIRNAQPVMKVIKDDQIPQPQIITDSVPKDHKVIVFMVPGLDSCVDKVVGEYAGLFFKEKITLLVSPDHLPYNDALRLAPEMVVFLRSGTQAGKGKEYEETLRQMVGYCKVLKIPTAYYVDDFIFPVNNGLPLQLAANCSRIITPSTYLKNWMYEAGIVGPIAIVPTHIDLEYFDKQPESTLVDPNRFNILIASTGRLGLASAIGLASYMNDNPEKYKDVTLVMASHGVAYFRRALSPYRNIDKVYTEVLGQDKFYSLCKSCKVHMNILDPSDISYLVPREYQEQWLNGKSPVKYLLAGASKSVLIYTPTTPYSTAVNHGETGLYATCVEEALTYIDAIRERPKFGESIGKNARDNIEKNWEIKNRYQRFKDALYGLENWEIPRIRVIDSPRTKIGWVLCGPDTVASARIEGTNIHKWLINKGVNSSILFQPREFRHHLTLETDNMDDIIKAGYDTVVFQKVYAGDVPPFVQKITACGIKSVWNISDFVEQGMVMSKICTDVVTTNNYLKSKFPQDAMGKIAIIKDAYESPRELCKPSYSQLGSKIRVVWFGSGAHFNYSSKLRELVEGLDMEYVTISSPDVKPDKIWNKDQIFEDIMTADIIVIPSELNEFDKCKDENKLVQCMVLGLPVISSLFPSYLPIVKQGVNGFLADKTMDWVKILIALKDEGLRESVGRQARLDVVDKYNIDVIGEQWLEVLTR